MRTLTLLSMLPTLALSAEGGGGGGGGGVPTGGEGVTATGGETGGATEAAKTYSQAELNDAIQAQVAAALSKAKLEAERTAAIDGHWNGVYGEHKIDEALRPLVRGAWDALPVKDGEERPDPAAWIKEQPWLPKLRPPASVESARTTGKSTAPKAETPAAPEAPTAPKPPTPPTAPTAPGLPSWLTRGPAAPPASGKQPASNPREALQRVAAAARASNS